MDMARIRIDDLNDKLDLNGKDLEKVGAGTAPQPTQKFGNLERLTKSSLSGAGTLGL